MKKILSLMMSVILILSGFTLVFSVQNVKAEQPSPTLVRQTYALNDNFNDNNLYGWNVTKMHSSTTVEINNGILHVQNEAWAGWRLNHTINAAKQTFNYSFEFMCAEGQGAIDGPPVLFGFKSYNFGQSPVILWTWWGLIAKQQTNRSIYFAYDNGAYSNPPTLVEGQATPPLVYGTWYQFYVNFNSPTWDKVTIEIYNRNTKALFASRTVASFLTHENSNNLLPDELIIGNPSLFPNFYQNWYFDNMTITQDSPDYNGIEMPLKSKFNLAINGFGTRLLQSKIGTNIFNEGSGANFPDWTTNPAYKLNSTTNYSGRDDVAGDMINLAANLYAYTKDNIYLNFAQNVWQTVLTHRQPDGGWTFGNWTVDYSDTDSVMIEALLKLYEITKNIYWLNQASETIDWLLEYQRPFGDVFGRVDRASPWNPTTDYSGIETNSSWFTSAFIIALFEYYKYTNNITVYNAAIDASDFIVGFIPESGRALSPAFGAYFEADFNDVSSTGTNLRALIKAYEASNNQKYLNKCENVSKILIWSQYTKDNEGFGYWTGNIKERYNQSDILYNYQNYQALVEYLKYQPENEELKGAIAAGFNFLFSIQGYPYTVNPTPIYNVSWLWLSSWNANDTGGQGWTCGWFNEGGWGTWGLVMFFGWQSNVILSMISYTGLPWHNPYIEIITGLVILFILIGCILMVMEALNYKGKFKFW